MFAPEDKREAMIDALVADGGKFHEFLTSFSEKCLGDTKFLSGDEVSVHDFVCAGFFVNVVLN